MAPKKKAKEKGVKPEEGTTSPYFDDKTAGKADSNQANTSKKRKQPPAQSGGTRKSARGASKAEPSPEQLLKYMLSVEAAELCRPEDESRDLAQRKDPQKVVTYTSSVLNPYQELVCAVVLSRPISHMLGLRTARTIFNAPYEFTSAKKMQDAGMEKIHQALWDARTQHKAKTADQLGALADMALDLFSDDKDKEGRDLGVVLGSSAVEKSLQNVQDKVKGFGPTGKNIFRRRVQWLWPAAYPFVDERSSKALEAIGLPNDADALKDFIDEHWETCDTQSIAGQNDEEKKRRALVIVLERATGADLEGKVERLREAAESH